MRVEPIAALEGHLSVPGDKSISHRAVLVASMCVDETTVRGFGRSADTEATIAAARALGVQVEELDVDSLRIEGQGLRGLAEPEHEIDCGNAGTLMRLLAGVVAANRGRFELIGDESLSTRPMERIAEPLRRMGARIETLEGHPPLVVEGGELRAIDYELPVASAQVKSAVLLAGVQADGATTVVEPLPTRDHTERMLERARARITRRPSSVTVEGGAQLSLGGELEVAGDFSSAAPFLVAASMLPGSMLTVHGVGLNPRRTGLLDVLERMGARIAIYNRRAIGGEPAGEVEIHAAPLVGATVTPGEVPLLVDELPLLALAACHARGDTVVRGAGELRVKESDRLAAIVEELRRIGGHVSETRTGFRVKGVPARLRGGVVDARGDHRLAMLGAIAGITSREGVEIRGAEAVETSFPGFFALLEQIAPGSVHYPPAA